MKTKATEMNSKLSSTRAKIILTLKAWPVITLTTIALCFLTQQTAKLFGIELPDQANLSIVRRMAGLNWNFALLVLQIIVILPICEELIFRLPLRAAKKRSARATWIFAAGLSALFSAAHYIAQPFPDSAFVALFAFGLAQCRLYRKTDSIFCPILNHALFNLTNLILLFIVPEA
jgi:membrane protease YdiL (CAAX protease family)